MKRDKRMSPPQGGRPLIPIDWDEVDRLLMAGCKGVQIAAYYGMHPDTLYIRSQTERGIGFSELCRQKKEKGNSLLLLAQFKMALEKDRGMLIWLGKNRLGQRDEPISEDGFNGEVKQFVDYLKKKYSSDQEEIDE